MGPSGNASASRAWKGDQLYALFARSRTLFAAVVAASLLVIAGCGSPANDAGDRSGKRVERSPLVLASTTSTQDSGLFDVLIPEFEKAYPEYEVKVIAVGTGEALKLGETKDADVLLVHAKADEEKFVAVGFGAERLDVMYNDYILVGPSADPANVSGSADAAAAFKRVADSESVFVSRGDDSGTHKKEKKIWDSASVRPVGDWYQEAGQGMGEVLKIASEKQGYTLADRATYLSMKDSLDLVVAFEKSKDLLNQYGVITVTDATNTEGAEAFADWITSAEGQAVIEQFGVEQFGEPLFVPNAEAR